MRLFILIALFSVALVPANAQFFPEIFQVVEDNVFEIRARQDIVSIIKNSSDKELDFILNRLESGNIDGRSYNNDKCCLVGTIAKFRKKDHNSLTGIVPNFARPAELFFKRINDGDTPSNNRNSRLAVEWIKDFKSSRIDHKKTKKMTILRIGWLVNGKIKTHGENPVVQTQEEKPVSSSG